MIATARSTTIDGAIVSSFGTLLAGPGRRRTGYLLYFVVSQVIGTVISMLSPRTYSVASRYHSSPGDRVDLVSIVSAPFVAAMITIIYFDLRVRKVRPGLMARDLERWKSATHLPGDTFGLGDPGNREGQLPSPRR